MAVIKSCWNRLKTQLSNLPLKYKFLGMFFINSGILLAAFLLCFFICTRAYNQQLYKTVAGNLSYSSGTISSSMKNIETLSSMILSDNAVQNSLSTIKDTQDPVLHYNAGQILNSTLFSYYDTFRDRGVAYIAIKNQESVNCTNLPHLKKVDPAFLHQVFDAARSNNGSAKWIWKSGHRDYLFLTRDIRQIKNFSLDSMGELVINVNMEEIVDSANTAAIQYDNSYYIIVDDSGSVIYSSKDLTPKDLDSIQKINLMDYGLVPFNGHTYFAVHGIIPDYSWNYINLIPFDTIRKSLDLSLAFIILILIAVTILVALLSRGFIRSIITHFNALNYKMVEFSKNELAIPKTDYPYARRQDEIGMIHQQFDAMMNRVRSLVNTNYINEILKRDAQLKALEAQINPHFLYNTLEAINWRAKASGNEKISQMAESLGTLLRATLSNKKSFVTLSYELELVNCYMTIQKLRFEDELEYQLLTSPELENAVIPPLTIQPLVENSIHYGMENIDDVCHILVIVTRLGGELIIKVQNDGSVMEDSLLERLKSNKIQPNGLGIGILNINQRIQLLFGKEYGLSFSNENDFATATLTIAYKTEV